MVTTERDYKKQSYAFLQQAQEELEKDDLQQASEKGWGAAAQMVKAVAVLRGLDHQTHRQLFSVLAVWKMSGSTQGLRQLTLCISISTKAG